ncbi:MAG: hypothetical protein R3F43_10970 [bacterium]
MRFVESLGVWPGVVELPNGPHAYKFVLTFRRWRCPLDRRSHAARSEDDLPGGRTASATWTARRRAWRLRRSGRLRLAGSR